MKFWGNKDIILKMKYDLPERTKLIIILRTGMYGNEKHTLSEIGSIFGISGNRVHQILMNVAIKMLNPKIREQLKEIPEYFINHYKRLSSQLISKWLHDAWNRK